MHQRILVAAVVAFMVAGTAQAASQGSGAGTATAAGAAAAATAAATDHNTSAPAAGSDLALLFGGLGAIGFVSWRRGRFEA
ncbi:hypothetical protein MW290_07130 [Aquincola tertiaricarbonis]|uniref:Uncharacterized protein n=1 Tax=Aquincola tertiaricarbonis TaxID=391953 RepID=A0ABY4S6L9_AQUTE|nr:hypothetical protein [Aquincola tertiaricarbonis]URI08335.1 hypothetical protein MW290_07130 [Aquincola tertiaricarbonis]